MKKLLFYSIEDSTTRIMMFAMLLWMCIHTGQPEKLSYKVKSVRVLSPPQRLLLAMRLLLVLRHISLDFTWRILERERKPTKASAEERGSSWWYFGTESTSSFDINVEYDVCDVTLSVHPHRASWEVCLTIPWLTIPRGSCIFRPILARIYFSFISSFDINVEYDVCDVTLSVHPHRASWKVCLTIPWLTIPRGSCIFRPILARIYFSIYNTVVQEPLEPG